MPEPFESLYDVFFSYDGDIDFENGDLKHSIGLDCLKRTVYKLMRTLPGSWPLYPDEGASPEKFIGEPNTREVGKKLEAWLIEKLERHVTPASIITKVVPVSRESIKVYIDINIAGMDVLTVPFTIDYINGIAYPQFDEETDIQVSSKNIKFNDSNAIKHHNPIWDRIRSQ